VENKALQVVKLLSAEEALKASPLPTLHDASLTINEHDSPVKALPRFESNKHKKLSNKKMTMNELKGFPALRETVNSDEDEVTFVAEDFGMDD